MTALKNLLALVLCWGLLGSWCCCQGAAGGVGKDVGTAVVDAPVPAGCCNPRQAEPVEPGSSDEAPVGHCGCGDCACAARVTTDLAPPLAAGIGPHGPPSGAVAGSSGRAGDLFCRGSCKLTFRCPSGPQRPAARELLRCWQIWQV